MKIVPAPTFGKLVSIDENLIVTPPKGMEVGFVPVVVKRFGPEGYILNKIPISFIFAAPSLMVVDGKF